MARVARVARVAGEWYFSFLFFSSLLFSSSWLLFFFFFVCLIHLDIYRPAVDVAAFDTAS